MKRSSVLLLVACVAFGQSAFEVASVKPSSRGDMRDRFGAAIESWMRGGPGTPDPGQITFTNASLDSLLVSAYSVKRYQISGPAWLDADGFNVIAKVAPGASKEQVKLMLQSLLAERFRLKLHIEKRELPVYVLSVGKNGPKMKLCQDPDTGGSVGPWNGNPRVVAPNWTMRELADFLAPRLDRPVLDETGLTARYDFTLYWIADNFDAGHIANARNTGDDAAEPAPTIFAAVQQLGLKLERSVSAMDVLVIDHAEKTPTEN
jgi:uncharacterized protein (TIGR03435 family)